MGSVRQKLSKYKNGLHAHSLILFEVTHPQTKAYRYFTSLNNFKTPCLHDNTRENAIVLKPS